MKSITNKFVIAVKLSNPYFAKESDITDVKLKDGTVESVQEVIENIDTGIVNYFVNDIHFPWARIQVVHKSYPLVNKSYIRTVKDWNKNNNLLDLPRF